MTDRARSRTTEDEVKYWALMVLETSNMNDRRCRRKLRSLFANYSRVSVTSSYAASVHSIFTYFKSMSESTILSNNYSYKENLLNKLSFLKPRYTDRQFLGWPGDFSSWPCSRHSSLLGNEGTLWWNEIVVFRRTSPDATDPPPKWHCQPHFRQRMLCLNWTKSTQWYAGICAFLQPAYISYADFDPSWMRTSRPMIDLQCTSLWPQNWHVIITN